jgi:hypothetical protein
MKLTTANEQAFLGAIVEMSTYGKKLIHGRIAGNNIDPSYEIRYMGTLGGGQFGMAAINFLNQREGGLYTRDVEEVYLRAIDVERRQPSLSWFVVDDVEHTVRTAY